MKIYNSRILISIFGMLLVTLFSGCRDVTIDVPKLKIIQHADDGGGGIEPYVFGMQWEAEFGQTGSVNVKLLEPVEHEGTSIPPKLGNNVTNQDNDVFVPEYNGRAQFYDLDNAITTIPAQGATVPLQMYGMVMCALEADTADQRLIHRDGFSRIESSLQAALEANVAAIQLTVGGTGAFDAIRGAMIALGDAEFANLVSIVGQYQAEQDQLLSEFRNTVANELPATASAAAKEDIAGAIQSGVRLIYGFAKYLAKREGVDDFFDCVHLTRVNATDAVWSSLKGSVALSNDATQTDFGPLNCSNRRHPVCPDDKPFGSVSFGVTSAETFLQATPLTHSSTTESAYWALVQRYGVGGGQNISAIPEREGRHAVFASIPDFRSHGTRDFSLEIVPTATDYDLHTTDNPWNASATVEVTTAYLPDFVNASRNTHICTANPSCTYQRTIPAGYDGVLIPEVLELDQPLINSPFDIQITRSGNNISARVYPGYGADKGRIIKVRLTLLTWPSNMNVEVRQQELTLDALNGTEERVWTGAHDVLLITPIYGENRPGPFTGYTARRIGPEYGTDSTSTNRRSSVIGTTESGNGKYVLQVTEIDFYP